MSVLVERDHIGIFGKMNAGKSSLMNLLTQQETSIVDPTPGTTTDTKVSLLELHGMGPVKLFDTAGIDERHRLGDKKRKKALSDLKECDLLLLVIDPRSKDLSPEKKLIRNARMLDKQVLTVYNIFGHALEKDILKIEKKLPLLRFSKKISLHANNQHSRSALLKFIKTNYMSKNHPTELLPFIQKNEFYILVIPMDSETPPGRYLRPQAMAEEYITRHWAYPVSYRLDLAKARSTDKKIRHEEHTRFERFFKYLHKIPKAIITDSQAMDIMNTWAPKDVLLTTFSIMMINYASRGRLNKFARGIHALDSLKKGDKVLIVEACNHSRIGEDIGTVQIPSYIKKTFPGSIIEHNFGREFQDNEALNSYKLVIHCGGCMISPQKLQARIHDLDSLGIPYTNYGLLLSYKNGKDAFRRVLKPWKLQEEK